MDSSDFSYVLGDKKAVPSGITVPNSPANLNNVCYSFSIDNLLKQERASRVQQQKHKSNYQQAWQKHPVAGPVENTITKEEPAAFDHVWTHSIKANVGENQMNTASVPSLSEEHAINFASSTRWDKTGQGLPVKQGRKMLAFQSRGVEHSLFPNPRLAFDPIGKYRVFLAVNQKNK